MNDSTNETMLFDEEKHEYTKNNKKYISVTQLLKKYGLSADYAGIPTNVLEKAAQRGKAIHKGLELYIKSGNNPQILDEVNMLERYVTARGIDLTTSKAEEIVYNDTYGIAGTIDWQFTEGADEILWDHKSTSSIYMDSVSWQLSIYNYLKCNGDTLTYYLKKLKVGHFYNNRMSVRDVPTIEYDQVEKLLEAHKRGDTTFTYVKDTTSLVTDSEDKILSQIMLEMESYKKAIKELEVKAESIQNVIQERMERTHINYIETDLLKISYVYETTRRTIDKDMVELLGKLNSFNTDDYTKVSTVKARLKVSTKQ